MSGLWDDLRHGLRFLFQKPAMVAAAVVALTLGLGLCTTLFSVFSGVLHKRLPVPEPDRLVRVYRTDPHLGQKIGAVPFGELQELKRRQHSCAALAGYYIGTVNLAGDFPPRRESAAYVDRDFLSVLGVSPILGTDLPDAAPDPAGPRPVAISEVLWQGVFRSDPRVVGRTLRVNGEEAVIIAVLPAAFRYPDNELAWVWFQEKASDFASTPGGPEMALIPVGRLRPDVGLEEARREFLALSGTVGRASAGLSPAPAELHLVRELDAELEEPTRVLWVMLLAGLLLLLIACANVANLLFVRNAARRKELAIRSALGATRARLLRQLLAESLILSLLGTAGGLLLASWLNEVVWYASRDIQRPFWVSLPMDGPVIAFAAALCLLSALLSGLWPAWQASRLDLNEALKDSARTLCSPRANRFSRWLTAGQIALSCLLLVGAGLTLRTIQRYNSLERGYDPSAVLTARFGLFQKDYPEPLDRLRFLEAVLADTRELPGVAEAGLTSWISIYGSNEVHYQLEGQPAPDHFLEAPACFADSVSPSLFQVYESRLLEGRWFDEGDQAETAPVMIVNQSFAQRAWPGESAVGRRIKLFKSKETGPSEDPWRTVVGVVSDFDHLGVGRLRRGPEAVFQPLTQEVPPFITLALRAKKVDPATLLPMLHWVVQRHDPHLPLYFVRTMEEFFDQFIATYRLLAGVLLALGGTAIFLSTIGLYGVMSFSVRQRHREIGIRLALGAAEGSILRLVLRQSLLQLTAGLTVGLAGAYALSRLLAAIVFGVRPADPVTFLGVTLLLSAVALSASFLPARRASRTQPLEALRYE